MLQKCFIKLNNIKFIKFLTLEFIEKNFILVFAEIIKYTIAL